MFHFVPISRLVPTGSRWVQVRKFCLTILHQIEYIAGFRHPGDPAAILIHSWEDWGIPCISKQLISILISTAKSLIAAKWKSNDSPWLIHWYSKIWEYLAMDKIADRLAIADSPNYWSEFIDIWIPFLNLSHSHTEVRSSLLNSNSLLAIEQLIIAEQFKNGICKLTHYTKCTNTKVFFGWTSGYILASLS